MSRHRNVRNLTEDDYYDDYDDYNDDGYDYDNEDDYYYQQQQEDRRKKQQQASAATAVVVISGENATGKNKKKKCKEEPNQSTSTNTATTTTTTVAAKTTIKSSSHETTAINHEENVRLVMGMGFSKENVELALKSTNGDVSQAIDILLLGGTLLPTKPSSTDSLAPTLDVTMAMKKPVTLLAAPLTLKVNHPSKVKTTSSITEPEPIRKVYGPPPKLSPAIQNELSHHQKSRLSMVVLGHVDAGKSTLMGQVLLQLGHVPLRTMTKYQAQAAEVGKASFALAWVMDEDSAERERGVTMDVATKKLSTLHHDITVLDAPGHADFVPSMITGAAAADVGLLVIAAARGEFETGFHGGGQTREHVILARGLGVSQLIVAVNKLDLCDWSQARLEEIERRLKPFLIKSGFLPKRITFVPISGLDGTNVKEKAGEDVALSEWYQGPTLLAAMDAFFPAQRKWDKPLRVIVSDVYSEGNKGVTVKCRIAQGVVQVNDKIAVLPIGDDASVNKIDHGLTTGSSIHRFKYAMAGDCVEIVLLGIDIARVSAGSIFCHSQQELRPPMTRRVICKVLIMDDLRVPIIRGASVLVHMHSMDVPAVITKLFSSTASREGQMKENPRVLTSGVSGTVELTFKSKVCVEAYNDCRALGRFVLRRGGDTIAVGIIEQVLLTGSKMITLSAV
jgi:elongation factor 1 alpha-like protein